MSLVESIYARLPVPLQNVCATLQGWSYVRKRYRGTFPAHVDALMRSQWCTAEQYRTFQNQELRRLLQEAYDHVPWHQRALSKQASLLHGMEVKDLPDLPFMEKADVRGSTDQFINKSRLKYGYKEGHTSGTSGHPFIWPYDYLSGRHNLAFRERQYYWAGISHHHRSARFSGRILLGKHERVPYWRHNAAENQWLFSTYHITEESLPQYYDVLRQLNFRFLDGYPSALFQIAQWVNRQGLSGTFRPWAIITTAETLMDFQRAEIQEAFQCKVYNFYSSSEGAPFVTQCEAGRMHLNPESGIIEFIRPDGSYADPGEEAEIVVTSFFQRTLPLIRYRIGDVATLSLNQECPCGRHMPVIDSIGGRESDVVFTKQRGRIGSAGLSTALYKIPHRMKQSQLEQTAEDRFVFRYVPAGEPLNEAEKKIVLNALHDRLGSEVMISIVEVNAIPCGARGKTRLVIGLKR